MMKENRNPPLAGPPGNGMWKSARRLATRAFFFPWVAFLGSLLFLQGKLWLDGKWRVPGFLLGGIHQYLAGRDLELSHGEMVFIPPGKIVVREAELRSTRLEETILSSDILEIRISPAGLLRKKAGLTGIKIRGGTVSCPASLSPTDRTEQPLRIVFLDARLRHGTWVISRAGLSLGELRVTAEGPVPATEPRPPAPPPPEPPDPVPPLDWEDAIARILPWLVRARDETTQAEAPLLHARAGRNDKSWYLALEAKAAALTLPGEFHLRKPRLQTRFSLKEGEWRVEEARLEGEEVKNEEDAGAAGWFLSADWSRPLTRNQWIPHRLDLFLADLKAGEMRIDGADFQLRHLKGRDFDVRLRLNVDDEHLLVGGEIDANSGHADLEAEAWLNPTPFMEHPLLSQMGFRREVSFEQPVSFFAQGLAGPRWEPGRASGIASTRRAMIDGVAMDAAKARAEVSPERFSVSEMVLRRDDYETVGQYGYCFAEGTFRFLFEGTLRPPHLNPWFKGWWEELWDSFRLAGDPLRGDVDIRGRFGHPGETRLTGRLAAGNLIARGCGFAEVDLGLRVEGYHTEIFDFRGQRREGDVEGRVGLWMNRSGGGLEALELDVRSTAEVGDLAGAFGEAGLAMVEGYVFHQPPDLRLRGGWRRGEAEPVYGFLLTGESRGRIGYGGLALDDLRVEAEIGPDAVVVEGLEAAVAGGRAVAKGARDRAEGRDRLDFELAVEGADFGGALDLWRDWRGVAGENARPGISGVLDLDLGASGDFGDTGSFEGKGGVRIRDADLGELHLLGLLSRLLSGTPLGFTSLQFDKAVSDFELRGDLVRFPNLELTGPGSALRASGVYAAADAGLDFAVRVYLMRESRIPLLGRILYPITEPLANVLMVRLGGTVEEPKWHFVHGPRGWLETLQTAPER